MRGAVTEDPALPRDAAVCAPKAPNQSWHFSVPADSFTVEITSPLLQVFKVTPGRLPADSPCYLRVTLRAYITVD